MLLTATKEYLLCLKGNVLADVKDERNLLVFHVIYPYSRMSLTHLVSFALPSPCWVLISNGRLIRFKQLKNNVLIGKNKELNVSTLLIGISILCKSEKAHRKNI